MSARLASHGQATDDNELRGTTEQHNAHNTRLGMVWYRWHPLHGVEVCVEYMRDRGDGRMAICLRTGVHPAVRCELPEWMLDEAACRCMPLERTPRVGGEVYRLLRELVTDAAAAPMPPPISGGHFLDRIQGDAHDHQAVAHPPAEAQAPPTLQPSLSANRPAADALRITADAAGLERAPRAGAAASAPAPGADARPKRCSAKGGGR